MIVELGHLALVIALGLALLLAASGLIGAALGERRYMAAATTLGDIPWFFPYRQRSILS